MAAPASAASEYIVFTNISSSILDLSELQIHDNAGNLYTFPVGLSLAAGASHTICKSGGAADTTFGVSCDGTFTGGLNNTGEELTVRAADGVTDIDGPVAVGSPDTDMIVTVAFTLPVPAAIVVPEPTVPAVDAIFECWEPDPQNEGMYIAHFGYENQTGEAQTIPFGSNNSVTPGSYQSFFPERFDENADGPRAGRTGFYPDTAVQIPNWDGEAIVWNLPGGSETASLDDSLRCPEPEVEPVSPILECVANLDDGAYRAFFGWENPNEFDVTIPVGAENKFTGGAIDGNDQGQTTEFTYPAPNFPNDDRMGRTGFYPDHAFSVDFDGSELVWTLNGKTATASDGSKQCPIPEPEEPTVCSFDGEVISYTEPVFENDGDPVAPARRDVTAIENGVASYSNFFGKEENDWQVSPLDFFSLGIGGELVYEFTDQIAVDQPGADIAIWEITGGTAGEQSDEQVNVYLSQDGVTFEMATTLTGDGTIDIADTSLDYVTFVKLVDDSTGVQGSDGDGYDVDAITIIDGACQDFSTIVAHKIVCTDESELPNWGTGGETIDADTAADWVAENDSCRFAAGWEFEWAEQSVANPDNDLPDNPFYGAAGGDWNLFGPTDSDGMTSTHVPATVLDANDALWVREVLQEGYLPFTFGPGNKTNENDESAEIYCHTDTRNYDNYDRIDGVTTDETYYCVAWNHELVEVPQCTVTISSDETNTVAEKDDAMALLLSYIHPNWTTELSLASWIWGDDGPVDPAQDETQTFSKLFGWNSGVPVTSATLTIAADNAYDIDLNGTNVDTDLGPDNFSSTEAYDVTGLINGGNNELSIAVTNLAGVDDPERNPAGLYYELVIEGEGENCEIPYEPEPEYGPYCGDGENNQTWEQCDGGEGCTEYCTLANQCTALQLAQLVLHPTDESSASFDTTTYLGSASNPVPNETWFNLTDMGDDPAGTIANAAPGLAVSRASGTLTFAVAGGNDRNVFDYVDATVNFLGVDLGATNRAPIPGWPLEDDGQWIDVFEKNGDTTLDLYWWLTTGDDSASVDYTPGEEFDCPACKAGVEARVVVDNFGRAGDGQNNDVVRLGDGSTVNYGEWFSLTSDDAGTFITDPNEARSYPNEETENGLFVSRNGDGTLSIVLIGEHQPGGNENHEYVTGTIELRDAQFDGAATQAMPGDFKFENHPEDDGVPTNDGYDFVSNESSTEIDFGMWVDTASDGFTVAVAPETIVPCDDDTKDKPQPTHTITGAKWEDLDNDGVWDAGEPAIPGWTIFLDPANGTTTSTTTDSNGEYRFVVGSGFYTVREEQRAGWTQTAPTTTSALWTEDIIEDSPVYGSCSYWFPGVQQLARAAAAPAEQPLNPEACNFGNYREPTDPVDPEPRRSSRGGGSGGIIEREPTPQVLGATASMCPFLRDHMQIGWDNNSWEVIKLQLFLSMVMGYDNPITGEFDRTTDQNVKAFQEVYRAEVLDPWFEAGIVPHDKPTGFVYKTTKWKINDIVCPGDPFPSLAGETLNTNVDIDHNNR